MTYVNKLLLGATFLSTPVISFADNAILDSLRDQEIKIAEMSSGEMKEIKGAALISGQPRPSVTVGQKDFHVSWKGFGSTTDYRQYRIVGNSYSPSEKPQFVYEGNTYNVAGDRWLADLSGNPNQWSAANARLAEYHYQVLDRNMQPTSYAFRETAWNRPISTFSW